MKQLAVVAVIAVAALVASGAVHAQSGTAPSDGKRRCADKHHKSSDQKEGINGKFMAHNFVLMNNCPHTVTFHMDTNDKGKPRRESKRVPAGKSTEWFCTDGYKGQADCSGGAIDFSVTYD
jgi:hypothetical protein